MYAYTHSNSTALHSTKMYLLHYPMISLPKKKSLDSVLKTFALFCDSGSLGQRLLVHDLQKVLFFLLHHFWY